jgi:hypothetical protein
MRDSILAIAFLVNMTASALSLANEQLALEIPMEEDVADAVTDSVVKSVTIQSTAVKDMSYGSDQNSNDSSGKVHGAGRHGKDQCSRGRVGMGHSGSQHGKKSHERNSDTRQRLDMIEARLSKIEAMLEILIRR